MIPEETKVAPEEIEGYIQMNLSKTNWTLLVTIALTIVNAVVPFMPVDLQATITSVLLVVAGIFHIDDVKIASAPTA